MEIPYSLDDNQPVKVRFNDFGSMFTLEEARGYRRGEILAYCSARGLRDPDHNQCWLLKEFLPMFMEADILEPVMDGPNMITEQTKDGEQDTAVLCWIIHPEFHDGGYSGFGDFSRERLGQQCQYASRYIEGRLDRYPNLGEGLRFNNGRGYDGQIRPLDSGDYHAIRIHRDDMDEFERRYRAYQEECLR